MYAAFGIRVPNLGENDKIIEKAQKRKLLTEDRFEVEAAYGKIQGNSMEAGLRTDIRCGKKLLGRGCARGHHKMQET